jgi:uncharacterized protein (TIGR02118 family)
MKLGHSLVAVVALAACSAPKETPKAADTLPSAATTAAPAGPMGPQAIVTVIYNTPKDARAFEKYYSETHLPLVQANQAEIGFTKAELTKFSTALDGKSKPDYYRQAELYFNSLDDAKKGMATAGFKKVADDLAKFASGGLVGLVAVETGDKGTDACPALATVIYKTPKDTAAFEKYYSETHIPLVGKGQAEIGFTRADLTRFVSNVDGTTPPALYRQAELCFPSAEARAKGLTTPAFMAVGHDLPAFATGGLVGLLGEQQ